LLGMAHHDLGDPWDNEFNGANQPTLTHQASTISDVSSMGASSTYGGSTVSLPTASPTPEPNRPYMREESDISHVRLSSQGYNGAISPVERRSSGSPMLPESLRVGTPPPSSSRGFHPFRKKSVTYEPVASSDNASNRTSGSRFSMKRKGSLLANSHGPIPEEEIDMSLLGSSMPMGHSPYRTSYGALEEEDREDAAIVSPIGEGTGTFDISSFTGPMSPQSEAHLKEINRQEASGILTGGLGVGLKPATTITVSDLYGSAKAPQPSLSPTTPTRRPSRKISFRNPGLSRTPTLRDLGQHEANKRGQIIEVIIEEEAPARPRTKEHVAALPVDISALEGGSRTSTIDFDDFNPTKSRKTTVSTGKAEIFYPQANWKPFSMRWPYLSALILISVVLAAAQEYLYRRGDLYSFTSPGSLNTWDYFTFKYLPTLVAVSYGILWQITDFEVKRLEAYYQLSKEGGALAAESINIDYITFFNFLRPFKALRYKHYAVAVSSIATLLAVSAVPTLQAASLELTPDRATREEDPLGMKKIIVNNVFSRLLSVVLVLVAVFGCVLVYQLQRRPSGLVADVKGIAGIAAMANRSHILMDFKNMDTATPEMIHKQLKTHRYSLRNSSLAPEEKIVLTEEERDKYDAEQHQENPHPLMLRLVAGIPFILGMVLFMILVPILLFERTLNVVTEKAPWLLTGLAVIIKLMWGTLETDIRMTEPFYILSKRHASPKVLTLDYTAMAFGWMPLRAMLNRHVLVGLVGLGSVLAEVLIVCASSFGNVSGMDFVSGPPKPGPSGPGRRDGPDDDGRGQDAGEETFASFWVSFVLAITILTFLCLVASVVYHRRRHPFLPRQPNTIASILAFIHQSKMLYDFVGTEKMNNDAMVRHVSGIGKTYGLGWFTGRDGEMHCGIDEEELASGYRHGDDKRKASMPWTTNWSDY
jgi:hypothetical protein